MSINSKGLGISGTQPFHKHQTHYHTTPKRSLTPRSNKKSRQFDPNMLPNPREYYARVLKKFHPRNNQATALCPFHSDKKPSFSINLRRGKFLCFSCGASGGDLIDFYRLMTGASFVEAVNYFEAWTYE